MELSYKVISSPGAHDKDIIYFLRENDADFYPPIAARKDLTLFVQNVYDEDGKYFVCYAENGAIVALTTLLANHPQFLYYYQYIAVDKNFRGRGIGSVLYDKVTEQCYKDGTLRAIVKTWSSNLRSQAMFRKHGFFHSETIEDDRSKGVHSLFFIKSFSAIKFRRPIKNLCIVGSGYGLINFSRLLFELSKEGEPLPFVTVNAPDYNDHLMHMLSGKDMQLSHIIFTDLLVYPLLANINGGINIEMPDLLGITKTLLAKSTKKWMLVGKDVAKLADVISAGNVVIPGRDSINRVDEIINDIEKGNTKPAYHKEELAAIASSQGCNGLLLGSVELHTMFGFDRSFKGVEIFDIFLEMAIIFQNARMLSK